MEIIRWISLLGIEIIKGGRVGASQTYMIIEILIGLELISLSGYILGTERESKGRNYVGVIKYMILSSIASGLIIIGVAKSWLILVTIGLVYKLGVLGNQNWIKDIYKKLSKKSLIWITGISKLGIVIILLSLIPTNIIYIIGIGSMITGTLLALIESDIYKIIGYSSITHTGWLLMTIYMENKIGGYLYIIQYILSTIVILEAAEKTSTMGKIEMTIVVLSLSGMPPLIGFYGKQIILLEMLAQGLYLGVFIGLLTSVIGMIYYIRIIKRLWWSRRLPRPTTTKSLHKYINNMATESKTAKGGPLAAVGLTFFTLKSKWILAIITGAL